MQMKPLDLEYVAWVDELMKLCTSHEQCEILEHNMDGLNFKYKSGKSYNEVFEEIMSDD
jgi:hypothetical protein